MRSRVLLFSVLFTGVVVACGSSDHGAPQTIAPVAGGGVQTGSGAPQPDDDAGVGASGSGSSSGSSGPGTSEDAAAPARACPVAPAWGPGTSQTIAIDFGDAGARSYDVYVGTGVQAGAPVPLVVNMHGLTNTPAEQATFSQMNPVADTNGFVVVYPAGIDASFNAGGCCGGAAAAGIDDVGFVRAVVADAESKICIDPKRVYETGFSNGGMMAYELACSAADLFAAVAPTEGENVTLACNPSRPVPLAAFQYLADPVVTAASAQASVQGWAGQLGCADAGAPMTVSLGSFTCDEWAQCNAGARAWYCTLPGGTHYPPLGSAPLIWSFLSQFTLP